MEAWDSKVVAALVAASIAALASVINLCATLWSNTQSKNHASSLEIAKYREKWLQQLRAKAVEVVKWRNACYDAPLNSSEKIEALAALSSLRLMVSESNPTHNKYEDSLDAHVDIFVGNDLSREDRDNANLFISLSQKIIADEWDEIQEIIRNGKKSNA